MINFRTGKELKTIPILSEESHQLYVYIMENSVGKIKIGKTTNIQQRYQSLSGSNGQGIDIERVYCSEKTYLYTLEPIMHQIYIEYRIPSTEWFYDELEIGELTFENVCQTLNELMSSESYYTCNRLRGGLYDN